MKRIEVAAAILQDGERIFATARGYGEQRGQWEFPGGKLEPGETAEEALRREIREELAVDIRVGSRLARIEYDYPAFHLSMDCFWCELQEGTPILLEAEQAAWLTRERLWSVPWLPADAKLIPLIEEALAH